VLIAPTVTEPLARYDAVTLALVEVVAGSVVVVFALTGMLALAPVLRAPTATLVLVTGAECVWTVV